MGTFINFTNASCDLCDSSCLTCNGPFKQECTSCNIQNGLYLYQNICVKGCPYGTFSDLNYYGNIYQMCIQIFESCIGPGVFNCASCSSNYLYYFANTKTCLMACPLKTFLSITSSECVMCDSSCLSCNGPSANDCLSCSINLYFLKNTCMSSCPNGYYSDFIYIWIMQSL